MKKIVFILSLLSVSFSYAQTYKEREIYFSPFWDFYSDNRLYARACGKGYTGIAEADGITGVILNPASLNISNKYQFYFEYVYKRKVEWYADAYLKELPPTFLFGVGFRINNYFQTGIVYYNPNSYNFDFGIVEFIDENGNVVPFHLYTDVKVSSFSIPLMFSYRKTIRYGINLIYSNYNLKEVFPIFPGTGGTGRANFNKFIPKFGIIVFPLKNFSMGLTFLPEAKETILKKWSNGVEERFKPNVFPSRIGIGFQYKLVKIPISFSFDYNHYDYSKERGLVDRKDIHFGAEYNGFKSLTLRSGFFIQKDYRSEDYEWIDRVGSYDQIFTTFGASYRRRLFEIDFSIMDSHYLSTRKIKQTYINSGIGYGF